MGWSLGWDSVWNRDIGYGVPALCDHPRCNEKIDRGLGYVCGYGEPHGGEYGCGLFFCGKHGGGFLCPRCSAYKPPYKHPKPDAREWIEHKLKDKSWAGWRKANPDEVRVLRAKLRDD